MDSSKSILIYIWKNKKDIFSLKNLKSLYSIGHILATIVICILMYVELIAIGTQANKYSVHSLENLIITDMICLVDERISEKCERALRIRGFNVIRMPADKRLGKAVASHPDMLIFAHENTLIANVDYCEKYSYIFTDIREFSKCVKMNFVSDTPGEKYPYDAIFNALVANGHI